MLKTKRKPISRKSPETGGRVYNLVPDNHSSMVYVTQAMLDRENLLPFSQLDSEDPKLNLEIVSELANLAIQKFALSVPHNVPVMRALF